MNYPKYDLSTSTGNDVFEFVSESGEQRVEKLIQFTQTDVEKFINLAFGDKIINNDGTFSIDDKSETNNGDRDKILATVAAAVYEYTSTYSEKYIIFMGSNPARTRLYRMAINKNYIELCNDYEMFGIIASENGSKLIPFDGEIDYEAFIVKRKTNFNLKNIVL